MNDSTASSFAARPRSSDRVRVVVLLVALISMVAVLGFSPGALTGRSAANVAEPASVGEPATEAQFGAERIAADTTTTTTSTTPTTTAVPASRGAAVVTDPRPGDLRVDPEADVLPAGYVASPASQVIRDLPYGPDDAQRLDLHLPAEPGAPVIVYLHHGGWYSGDRADVPEMVLRFLERGYAVASVGYRLAPEHPFPAPIHDLKQAIRELKVLGEETGLIDGASLVLYGVSAGGHLAAFSAATVGDFEPGTLTDAQAAFDSSVSGIVVTVGPADLVQLYAHPHGWAQPMTADHAGCDPCTVEQLELPSPVSHLHADMAPAYWAYGGLDPLIDAELQGRLIADAWADASGSESWFDLVEDRDHVLDETMINQRAVEDFVDAAVGR